MAASIYGILASLSVFCVAFTCPLSVLFLQEEKSFYEMEGDLGMSWHEKERKQAHAHQDRKSFITPSLHLCPTLKLCLFVMNEKNIFTSNCLPKIH